MKYQSTEKKSFSGKNVIQLRKLELLENAPIKKALLAMGIPTMIGMMINAIYNIADAYFVGSLGTSQMCAISVSFPISQIIVGIGLLFGSGASSYISRLLGKGEKYTANKVVSTSIYSGLGIGLIFILFVQIFLSEILVRLGATQTIIPYALSYSRICYVAAIFNIFNVMMNNVATSEGAAKTSMIALLTGAIINIFLDPIFITVLSFGVQGAAFATAIAQIISSLIYIVYILRKRSNFNFSIKKITFQKEIFSQIFKIGIPTLFFQLLTSISIVLVNTKAKMYGDSLIAAMGAVTRIVSMGSLIVFGFIKGFQPIAGFSYGAKKFSRLSEAIKTSILWSSIFCFIYGLLGVIFSEQIMSLFTRNDIQMILIGSKALRLNSISFMFFGYYITHSSLLLALGKGKNGLILGVCRQGVFFIPLIFILPMCFGVNGIIISQPIGDILSAICAFFYAKKIKKDLLVVCQK